MKIQLDYHIIFPEYIDGNLAIVSAKFNNFWLKLFLSRILPFFILLTGITTIWSSLASLTRSKEYIAKNPLLSFLIGGEPYNKPDAIFYLIMGFISLCAVFFYFANPKSILYVRSIGLGKQWQRDPLMGENRTLIATDTELIIKSATLQIACQWIAITRVIESDLVFIVSFFNGEQRMISKQALIQNNSLDLFRSLICRNVKKYIDLTESKI